MAWIIEIGGGRVTSDDFTLEDLGDIEKATEQPWSLLNPLASIPVAREFLRVALRILGDGDPEATVQGLKAKELRSAFTFESDVPLEGDEDADPLDRRSTSTRSSSRGARGGISGDPAKRSKSA